MQVRYLTIWFQSLTTDWHRAHSPGLAATAFVLAAPEHGRMLVTEASREAREKGIHAPMTVADARAIFPSLVVLQDDPQRPAQLLQYFAAWFIRYTPMVATDAPDGLVLEVTGCAHLWGGEETYLAEIISRLARLGYQVRAAMADTIGAAWAVTRYGSQGNIINSGQQFTALLSLPPSALRLALDTVERLEKLGLRQVKDFISLPRTALRRRFGQSLLQRMNQAIGSEVENIVPIHPPQSFQERLPSLEPIVTATGIAIALERLLDGLCSQLQKSEQGMREASFKCFRIDGKTEQINISTIRPSCNAHHLFKLFEFQLPRIAPGPGFELFVLEAPVVEDAGAGQQALWKNNNGVTATRVAELLDRISGKVGSGHIHRYLPDAHYWPERSYIKVMELEEQPALPWHTDRPRPIQLLKNPQPIEVTAPIPDYPPMLFRLKGKLHKITRADGPERIEQEWWLQEGLHRDYYTVEDEEGCRYWIFRSGHYDTSKTYQWFLHGFFA